MPVRRAMLVLMLATAAPAVAQNLEQEAASLEGWRSVGLVVEPLGGDAEDLGLSETEIRARIERRLTQAGLTFSDSVPGHVYFHLGLVVGKLGYSGAIQLGFAQRVTLGSGRKGWGTTWEQGRVLGGPHENLQSHVEGLLDQILDAFVSDWRAANPG